MDSSSEKEQEGEEKGKEEGEEKNLLQRREGKEEMRKTLACLQNLPSHGNLLEYNPLEETPQRCFVGLAKGKPPFLLLFFSLILFVDFHHSFIFFVQTRLDIN